jgi:4-amino-4-deoxy-L-arabinose transferase-like glycosyltransferase
VRPGASRPPFVVEIQSRLVRVWHWPALVGVLALAALLDLWGLTQNGEANTYYSAGVRSMLQSWGNFFFAAADPSGLESIDKAPLALWLQAASARVFGMSPASLLVPEAIAGVLAVWVLYLLLTRPFGRPAALVGALALAVSPVSVAINRDNNPDALFVLLLVVSAYLATRALRHGRLGWLLASAAAVGLAFDTKMLLALVVVPGIALAYLCFAPRRRMTRVWHLAAAGGVLLAVSGVWIAAVELTPAALRPFVSGTSDNSALSLVFGYNGFGRVAGQAGRTSIGGFGGRGLGGGGAFAGGGAVAGAPGPLRLFNQELGDQGAWLLPLAALGGIASVLVAAGRRDRGRLGPLTVLGGWFLCAAVVLSISSGIVHTYYVDVLAPATAALVGVGVVALWLEARRGGLGLLLPAAAVAATATGQLVLLQRSGYLPWLQVVVGLATAGALAVIVVLALRLPCCAGAARGRRP